MSQHSPRYFAFSVSLLILINNIAFSQTDQSNKNYSEIQISKTLKDFYTAYFTLQADPYPMEIQGQKIDSLLKKYCTKEFLKFYYKIEGPEELDWDPFLDAQECDIESLKTISIKKHPQKNDLFYVTYIKLYNKELTTIEVTVIKEKASYKINSLPQLTRHIDFVRSKK